MTSISSASTQRSRIAGSSGVAANVAAVVVMLCVAAASYALVQSTVSPALGALRRTYGTSQLGIAWVLTAFLLSSSVLTPILGRLGDQIGHRRVLVSTAMLLAVGSVVAASASDLGVLIVGRILQGAGGATLPLAFAIIRQLLPTQRVGAAVGAVASLSAVGGGIGLLLAGPVIDSLGARWLFWLPAAANAVVAVLLWVVLPRSRPSTSDCLNWDAAGAMTASLVPLLLALSMGQTWGWASGRIDGLLVGAVVMGAAWIRIEIRSATPLIDMSMMRLPAIWTANLASLLFGVDLYSSLGFIPTFVQAPRSSGYGFGSSIFESGLMFIPQTAVMLMAGLAAGPLARRVPSKGLLMAGALPPVASFALLAAAHDHRWQILLATGLGGLGFGLALSALSAFVVNAVPATHTGAAAGMNANIRTIGGAVGATLVAAILAAHPGRNGLPSAAGWTAVFVMLATAAVIGALTCLLIPSPAATHARRREDPEILAAEILDAAT